MANVLFGSARHDENGNISGGALGDQTGEEVCTQAGYVHKKGWNILRAKDNDLANGLAFCMAIACNNNIGYDQGNRLDIIKKGITTTEAAECDCSSLVRACLIQCGINIGNFTTANAVSTILNTGKFDKVDFESVSKVKTGDILCTKTKGHIVICVQGVARNATLSTQNIYTKPSVNVTSKANAKKHNIKTYISSGDGVRFVQYALKSKGYNIGSSGVDGICGGVTVSAIMTFQGDNGLTVDGVAGKKTLNKM